MEQAVVLEAYNMSTSEAVLSAASFGKDAITQLLKEIKDIKGMVVAQWTPDEATVVSSINIVIPEVSQKLLTAA